MATRPKDLSLNEEQLAAITSGPIAGSRKSYREGIRYPALRVPYREIDQTPTRARDGSLEANPAIPVYDSSGP
ncbi:MAG: phosphomethylpyrimidine synthase ThiC, partial [Acidithiobacillus sp.]